MTDVMVWRDSNGRQTLIAHMLARQMNGQRRLKLYADKIYITDAVITGAYSL